MRNTGRKIRCEVFARLLVVFLAITLSVSPAYAEETPRYETFGQGTSGAEIGIMSDNEISLDSEELVFDFSSVKAPLGDEVSADIHASYVLTNTSSKEKYISIAVPRLIKVKKVTINREDEANFKSGQTILVDGEEADGLIYVNDTMERLRKNSIYDTDREILYYADYKVSFNEGFSLYGKETDGALIPGKQSDAPLSETVDYYVEAEDGVLSLCSVIYNIKFEPGASRLIMVKSSMTGEMNRATVYTTMGTTYTFSYAGANINSFYNVGDVRITFILPDEDILPLLDCDTARFMDDNVWTVHFKGNGNNFSFTLGEELTKEQINDIYTAFGPGKIIINVVEVVAATIVIFSAYYIYYSVKKRKESGIGR
ncbi:MAG: hypothetical protein ACI39R_04300 [Lachnospiraceae bacterium]